MRRKAPSINKIFDNPTELLMYIECGGWLRVSQGKYVIYNGTNMDKGVKIPSTFGHILVVYGIVELDSGNWDYGEGYYHFGVENAYKIGKHNQRHYIINELRRDNDSISVEVKKKYIMQHRLDKLNRILHKV